MIPIIDISGIDEREALERVAPAVRDACVDTGFFYLTGHGISQSLIDAAFAASRWLHARPDAEKLAIKLNRWHRGYQPLASSTLKSSQRFAPAQHPNQLESFLLRHELSPDAPGYGTRPLMGPNQWPADAMFRDAITRYDAAVRALGHRMLRIFAVAVGEAPGFFDRFFAPASTALRLIHYPPLPEARPDELYGIHPHTDYGFLTLLVQEDVGGLEVRRPDGSWIQAQPMPGTFVLNVGDVLARWTNDRFNSTPHRVVTAGANRDRYSIAMFFDPHIDALVEGLPRFVREAGGAKYPSIRYGDYYEMRLEANYPDRVGS
jgi:isopenicillin N synthase-like dioxygenase